MTTKLPIDSIAGLTENEAARRLAQEGYNELPSAKPRSVFAIALSVVREPMFLLLIAAAPSTCCSATRARRAMLLGFVFVVMGLTLYQERKTERALEALRDLSSPRALVIRDGAAEAHPGPRGGARRLDRAVRRRSRAGRRRCSCRARNLAVDESLLPASRCRSRKTRGARRSRPRWRGPAASDSPFVFSGTLVVQGRASPSAGHRRAHRDRPHRQGARDARGRADARCSARRLVRGPARRRRRPRAVRGRRRRLRR